MIEDPRSIEFPCIQVKQPIGTFYLGTIPHKELCDITHFDVRRMLKDRDIETYLGIQRPLNKKRVSEISDYVTTLDACFPTAVILAVPGVCANYDSDSKQMILSNYLPDTESEDQVLFCDIAKVLDGQHRIEGLKDFEGNDFEINVSIFVDADIAEQAYIFSTVNLAQTKVAKSLVYDLYDLAKTRSPQKVCHNIAVVLDRVEDSPFYKRIKRLGTATEGRFNETITQATFVQALMRYISKEELKDRDIYLRGGIPEKIDHDESERYIFRNMMIDEKDNAIIDILWNYFSAVRERWPDAWESTGKGNILNKTNGFRALMRFLRDCYLQLNGIGIVTPKEKFAEILNIINIDDSEFTSDTYKPGSSGESELYRSLKIGSGLED